MFGAAEAPEPSVGISHLQRIASMKRILFVATMLALLAVLGTGASVPAKGEDKPDKDIVDTAVEAGQFKTLVTAVKAAELVETLKGKGPFTVFAPTDEAFAKLPKEKLEALLKDKKALTAILTYHVVPRKVVAADVVKFESVTLKTVEGSPIALKVVDGRVSMIGLSKFVQGDIVCSNGVIHVIDTVLLPPEFAGKGKDLAGLTIKGFCKKAYGGTGISGQILQDATFKKWDDAAKKSKDLLELSEALGKLTPTKGTAESWKDQCDEVLAKAKDIAQVVEKKDFFNVGRSYAFYNRCGACHTAHR